MKNIHLDHLKKGTTTPRKKSTPDFSSMVKMITKSSEKSSESIINNSVMIPKPLLFFVCELLLLKIKMIKMITKK